jgi:hypothetical protein
MHFFFFFHQQYVLDTAKEVQTSAVTTSQILTQPSWIWRYTKTLLVVFNIFSGQVLSFYVEIVTSDHLEKENNMHLLHTFQDLWMTTLKDTCDAVTDVGEFTVLSQSQCSGSFTVFVLVFAMFLYYILYCRVFSKVTSSVYPLTLYVRILIYLGCGRLKFTVMIIFWCKTW